MAGGREEGEGGRGGGEREERRHREGREGEGKKGVIGKVGGQCLVKTVLPGGQRIAYQCGFTVYSDGLASGSNLGNIGPKKKHKMLQVFWGMAFILFLYY